MDERIRNLMKDRGTPELSLEVDDGHLDAKIRAHGLALLDAIAVAVEAFNPIEVAYEEESRFACEGDTVDTVYCGWDGAEFYRNAVIADDVAGEAVYIQFGPRVVGEA
jgi:hypothetical protein